MVGDSELSLRVIEEALAARAGSGVLGVLIDVDVDMGRTGTRDRALIQRLAERISISRFRKAMIALSIWFKYNLLGGAG